MSTNHRSKDCDCSCCVFYEICVQGPPQLLNQNFCEDYSEDENIFDEKKQFHREYFWSEMSYAKYTETILTWHYDEYADGEW